MLINVKNANNCWHFNIYEHDKFHVQFSFSMKKKFYNHEAKILWKTMKTQRKCCIKQHFAWLGLHCLQKKKKKKKIPGFTNLCLLLKIVCYYLECFQMSVNVYVVNCFAPIICNHCPLQIHLRIKWGHKIHCSGISPTFGEYW